MRAKIITIVSMVAVFIGLIVLIQFTNSSKTPTQGGTADPVRGDANAELTIQEYGDFQCPGCRQLHGTLKQVLKDYPGKVKLQYNDYPLRTIHGNAGAAAEAGQCALAQNKFWEYHDVLYEQQGVWEKASDPTDAFVNYAKNLGLNDADFRTCVTSHATKASVEEDELEGQAAAVNSTPTIFVGEERLVAPSYDELKVSIDAHLAQ